MPLYNQDENLIMHSLENAYRGMREPDAEELVEKVIERMWEIAAYQPPPSMPAPQTGQEVRTAPQPETRQAPTASDKAKDDIKKMAGSTKPQSRSSAGSDKPTGNEFMKAYNAKGLGDDYGDVAFGFGRALGGVLDKATGGQTRGLGNAIGGMIDQEVNRGRRSQQQGTYNMGGGSGGGSPTGLSPEYTTNVGKSSMSQHAVRAMKDSLDPATFKQVMKAQGISASDLAFLDGPAGGGEELSARSQAANQYMDGVYGSPQSGGSGGSSKDNSAAKKARSAAIAKSKASGGSLADQIMAGLNADTGSTGKAMGLINADNARRDRQAKQYPAPNIGAKFNPNHFSAPTPGLSTDPGNVKAVQHFGPDEQYYGMSNGRIISGPFSRQGDVFGR